MLAIAILLKGFQFELICWIVIFILGILKVVVISLVLSGMFSLSMHPWIVIFLTWYATILSTLYILLIKYGDSRSGTANPSRLRDIHPNRLLLLGHHVPGIRRQEPLSFLGPVISGGLYKTGELISRYLR